MSSTRAVEIRTHAVSALSMVTIASPVPAPVPSSREDTSPGDKRCNGSASGRASMQGRAAQGGGPRRGWARKGLGRAGGPGGGGGSLSRGPPRDTHTGAARGLGAGGRGARYRRGEGTPGGVGGGGGPFAFPAVSREPLFLNRA